MWSLSSHTHKHTQTYTRARRLHTERRLIALAGGPSLRGVREMARGAARAVRRSAGKVDVRSLLSTASSPAAAAAAAAAGAGGTSSLCFFLCVSLCIYLHLHLHLTPNNNNNSGGGRSGSHWVSRVCVPRWAGVLVGRADLRNAVQSDEERPEDAGKVFSLLSLSLSLVFFL